MTYIHKPTIEFDPANLSAFGVLVSDRRTPVIQGDWVYGILKQHWAHNYVFTVTAPAIAPAVGDVYTVNNNYFVVIYSSGTTLVCQGSGDPTASGSLTRSSGAGTTPIAYSAYTYSAGVTFGTGATVDMDAARLRVQSGTSSTGYAYIQSKRPVRYRAGQGTEALFTPIFTSGSANNIQLWGVGSIVNNAIYDGYFYGYNGTSFGIVHYVRGVATWTAQSAWNGDKCDGAAGSTFTLNGSPVAYDPTKGTPAKIIYPYLGYGDILFFLQSPDTGRLVLVHVIKYANSTATTQLSNPSLNFIAYTLNSGNTSNKILYCGSVGEFIDGERTFVGNSKGAIDSVSQAVTATESCLVNIRNARKLNGVDNQGTVRLNQISLGLKEATVVTIRFYIGATIGGTPVWTAEEGTVSNAGATIASGQSPVSYDVAGTTVAAGKKIFNLTIGASGTETVDLTPHDLYIAPGEQMTISAVATANSTVGISLNYSIDI